MKSGFRAGGNEGRQPPSLNATCESEVVDWGFAHVGEANQEKLWWLSVALKARGSAPRFDVPSGNPCSVGND
jgi:hypothetical protein